MIAGEVPDQEPDELSEHLHNLQMSLFGVRCSAFGLRCSESNSNSAEFVVRRSSFGSQQAPGCAHDGLIREAVLAEQVIGFARLRKTIPEIHERHRHETLAGEDDEGAAAVGDILLQAPAVGQG